MLDRDPELRVVLVPFPVLGAGSIEASRVELAIAKLARGGVEGTFVRTAQAGSNAFGSRSVGAALLRRRRGGLAGR